MIDSHTSKAIDLIRGLSAVGVIYGHAIYGLDLPIELNGAYWVWIFLVISGFLLGQSFNSKKYEISYKGFIKFFTNRSLRIVPLAWLALSVGACIQANTDIKTIEILWQYFFVPEKNDMSLCGPLWTVACEMQFYVLGPILLIAILKFSKNPITIIWALILLQLYFFEKIVLYFGDNLVQPRTLAGNLPFFLVGILLSLLRTIRIRFAVCFQAAAITLLVALAWWLYNYHPNKFWGEGGGIPLGMGSISAILVAFFTLSISPSKEDKPFFYKDQQNPLVSAFEKIGFYCYGVYVWHAILAQINNATFELQPGLPYLFFLSLAVLLAPISYRLIEKPVLKLKIKS